MKSLCHSEYLTWNQPFILGNKFNHDEIFGQSVLLPSYID